MRTSKFTYLCGCCYRLKQPCLTIVERVCACDAHQDLSPSDGMKAATIVSAQISAEMAEAENANGL